MKQARSFGSAMLAMCGALGVTLAAAPARAEQFVLLDVTFSFTKMQADTSTPSKSHYYVKADRLSPKIEDDWTVPVDFRNGVVHVRTEVLEKPAGSENTQWTLCYIANEGGYGCTNTTLYKEEGVYDREESMTDWWQNEDIDWTAGIKQMDLVMKDGSGGSGFAHLRPDFEKFFPTTVRITMVQVSAGSTYDPKLVPNLPDSGGGGAGGGGAGGGSGSAGETAGGSAGQATAGAASGGGGAASGGQGTAGAGAGGGGQSSATAGAPSGAGTAGSAQTPATNGPVPSDDGGCSTAAGGAGRSHFAVVLALLGLLAGVRRRTATRS